MTRFMSAYKEVEYRYQNGEKGTGLGLKSRLGSKERVKEFITFIVASGGSKLYFEGIYDEDMMHIAPQIGSVLLARRKENMLNLYRFEAFNSELERLARDSGFLELVEIHKFSPKLQHDSDQYSVMTLSAFRDLQISSRSNERDLRFILAICRLYIADYICLNYSVPDECSSVQVVAFIFYFNLYFI